MKISEARLSVRIPQEELTRLNDMAILSGRSKSSIIRSLIANASVKDLPIDWTEFQEGVRRLREMNVR
jgi:predicted DNA-binding protein